MTIKFAVGERYIIERRFSFASTAVHRHEATVVKLTKKRVYFNDGCWVALDDPKHIVKPKYLDYLTIVVSS